jgi:hypothetical protein
MKPENICLNNFQVSQGKLINTLQNKIPEVKASQDIKPVQ